MGREELGFKYIASAYWLKGLKSWSVRRTTFVVQEQCRDYIVSYSDLLHKDYIIDIFSSYITAS